MARNITYSVKYFPIMVDIVGDPKVLRAELYAEEYAVDVFPAICRLFIWIYGKRGYYMEWGEDEPLIFAKENGGIQLTEKYQTIVQCLIRSKFFDQEMYEKYSILTSHGIQVQWKKIKDSVKGKGQIKAIYKINSSDDDINSDSEHINSEVIPAEPPIMQQSKVNESKVNEIKEDSTYLLGGKETKIETSPDQTPSLMPAPQIDQGLPPMDADNPLPPDQVSEFIFKSKDYASETYNLCFSYKFYIKGTDQFDYDKLYAWARCFNRWLRKDNVHKKTIKGWITHFKNWLTQQNISINPDELTMQKHGKQQSTTANPKVIGLDKQEAAGVLNRPGYYPGDQQSTT